MNETHGIAWIDTDGKVSEANRLFQDLLRYGPEELRGTDYRDLADQVRGQRESDRTFFRALKGLASGAEIVPHKTRSGERVWLQASYVVVRGDDGEIAKIA